MHALDMTKYHSAKKKKANHSLNYSFPAPMSIVTVAKIINNYDDEMCYFGDVILIKENSPQATWENL